MKLFMYSLRNVKKRRFGPYPRLRIKRRSGPTASLVDAFTLPLQSPRHAVTTPRHGRTPRFSSALHPLASRLLARFKPLAINAPDRLSPVGSHRWPLTIALAGHLLLASRSRRRLGHACRSRRRLDRARLGGQSPLVLASDDMTLRSPLMLASEETASRSLLALASEVMAPDSVEEEVMAPDSMEEEEMAPDSLVAEEIVPDSLVPESQLPPCDRCAMIHDDSDVEACRLARRLAKVCARCGLVHSDYDLSARIMDGLDQFDCEIYIPDVEKT